MEMNNQQNNMNDINGKNNMDDLLGEELNSDGGIENITKNVSLALATSLLANEQATIDNSTQIAGNSDNLQKLAQMVIDMQDQLNSLLSGGNGNVGPKSGQVGQEEQMAMGSVNPTQGAQPQQADPMEAIRILAQGQLAQQQQGQGQNVSGR